MRRNQTLDFLRGFTIILMIVFHFSFDLNYFHFLDLDLRHDDFWRYFRKFIVSSFVFIMGYSLVITYAKGVVWSKIWKRFRKIAFFALLITLATYFIFPKSYIYFGILHFMAVSTLVGVLFVKHPWVSLLLAVLIFMGYNLEILDVRAWMRELKPLLGLPRRSEDFIFFVPWWSAMFAGIFAGYFSLIKSVRIPKKLHFVNFMGRHSLVIYMIHQPILFGSLYLLTL